MKKTIFVAFILLLGILHNSVGQITIMIDKEPCVKCDVLVQHWGAFKTDEIGVLNLRYQIALKLGVDPDSLPKFKEVTIAILSTTDYLPTVIKTLPWSKTGTAFNFHINSVDLDGREFGSRLLLGEMDQRNTTIFVENSPQKITSRGIISEYVRYPTYTGILRLLFWNGVNDFEIVEIRSPKYKSPKYGAQKLNFVAPELNRNFYLTSFDVVLENPTIDLHEKIGVTPTYQKDELGRYWYMITVVDTLSTTLYYAGVNLQETIPASVKLQSEPIFNGSLELIEEKSLPLDVSRINLQVDLHYIVEKNTELPREVFDNTKTSKEHSKLTLLAKVGIGIGGILLVVIGYFMYFRKGGSDFV